MQDYKVQLKHLNAHIEEDLLVGDMGVPKYSGVSMTQHPQYATLRAGPFSTWPKVSWQLYSIFIKPNWPERSRICPLFNRLPHHQKLFTCKSRMGKKRADRHMPSYAKKIVTMSNKNGEIDQMLLTR